MDKKPNMRDVAGEDHKPEKRGNPAVVTEVAYLQSPVIDKVKPKPTKPKPKPKVVKARDINKNGTIDGFEKARAKGMAKGMGARFEAKQGGRPGLYANIHAKRKRIAGGSGETMRKVGTKGAPTKANFVRSAKTAKKQ